MAEHDNHSSSSYFICLPIDVHAVGKEYQF